MDGRAKRGESLAGKTVKNTAVISSDNMDPVDADHGVTVNPKEEEKPALSIDKSVNLSSASVGDTLSYTSVSYTHLTLPTTSRV